MSFFCSHNIDFNYIRKIIKINIGATEGLVQQLLQLYCLEYMKCIKIIVFTFLCFGMYSCTTIPKEENQIVTYSTEANWQYFDLEKAIDVKIINHLQSVTFCGTTAFASVTIVETKEGEKIRILDLCNTSNYEENEIIKVLPAVKPKFNVLFPNRILINPETKQNKPVELDLKVLKTTYGSSQKNNNRL